MRFTLKRSTELEFVKTRELDQAESRESMCVFSFLGDGGTEAEAEAALSAFLIGGNGKVTLALQCPFYFTVEWTIVMFSYFAVEGQFVFFPTRALFTHRYLRYLPSVPLAILPYVYVGYSISMLSYERYNYVCSV